MTPCIVCSSNRTELWGIGWDDQYFTSPDQFTYLRCPECRSVSVNPMLSDRLAEIYPTNYYAYSPPSANLVSRVKLWLDKRNYRQLLRRITTDRIRVLDIGGGSGWQLDILKSVDPRIHYTCEVDLDAKGAEIARQAGHASFCGRIEDFQSPEHFELILLLNLIEHVPNPREILEKVAALLAPGGLALIQTPNYDSLDARLFRKKNWGGLHCPRHFVLFELEGFSRLCAQAGLKVVHSQYTQGAPFWAWTCLGWLSRHGLISLSARRPAMTHPLFPLLCAIFAAFDLLRSPFSKPSQMRLLLARAD